MDSINFCRCCGGQIIDSADPHLCAECAEGEPPTEGGTPNEQAIVQILNPFGGGWDE